MQILKRSVGSEHSFKDSRNDVRTPNSEDLNIYFENIDTFSTATHMLLMKKTRTKCEILVQKIRLCKIVDTHVDTSESVTKRIDYKPSLVQSQNHEKMPLKCRYQR